MESCTHLYVEIHKFIVDIQILILILVYIVLVKGKASEMQGYAKPNRTLICASDASRTEFLMFI